MRKESLLLKGEYHSWLGEISRYGRNLEKGGGDGDDAKKAADDFFQGRRLWPTNALSHALRWRGLKKRGGRWLRLASEGGSVRNRFTRKGK